MQDYLHHSPPMLRELLVFATAGRTIRFATLIFLPQLLGFSTAEAQRPVPPASGSCRLRGASSASRAAPR